MKLAQKSLILVVLLLTTLFVLVDASFAFNVDFKVMNRWNPDGSNSRQLDMGVHSFGGDQNDITRIDFVFEQDGPSPPLCEGFITHPTIANIHYRTNRFFINTTTDNCFSNGGDSSGSAGARADGEYFVVFTAGNGETHDAPGYAASRINTFREMTSATLISPADTSVLPNNTPTLRWNAAVETSPGGATLTNRVIVERITPYSRVVSEWIGSDTSFPVQLGDLEEGVEYQWHIRTYDGPDWGASENVARSEVWTFTAGAAVNPIPTLNEWGLIIMAGLLALGSIIMMRRKTRES